MRKGKKKHNNKRKDIKEEKRKNSEVYCGRCIYAVIVLGYFE